jgi:peptidoglycan/LPS O-acetylase OafA/YrhL
MQKERILILDGFRVVAIVLVMLFHYYSRFLNTHYSYKIDIPTIFNYGYLGVEFFFIISGFVISNTLSKCNSFIDYIQKRFVRLIPAMIICSFITFLFITFFDSNNIFANSKSSINLIISNTFISPLLLNSIFSSNISYIDGAYWSLWVEIIFYFFAGFLYFFNSKNFLKNFSIFVFIGVILNFYYINVGFQEPTSNYFSKQIYYGFLLLFNVFKFFEYGLWFLIGVILKELYYNKSNTKLLVYMSFIFFIQTLFVLNFYTILFSSFSYTFLLLFIYKPKYISFLGTRIFSKIGVASYSIYLLHQNIGVLIINKSSYLFKDYNWILPIIIIALFCVIGIFSYKYLEVPFGKKIKLLVSK